MVSEAARSYMNSKPRSCSSETCVFQGTYSELRKHARSEHPYVRPSEVDPSRQYDWLRMEQERDMEDLFSTIHASFGSEERDMEDLFGTIHASFGSEERDMEDLFGTIHASFGSEERDMEDLFGTIHASSGSEERDMEDLFSTIYESSDSEEGEMEDIFSSFHANSGFVETIWGLGDLMSLFFDICFPREDADGMASLLSSSRPRVSLHDRRVSNDAQENLSARWRSNLPSPHQLERIHRGRWTSSLSSSSRNLEANRTARWRTNLTSSSRNLEANRTARWRTNLTSSSRMPRDDYREMSPGPRTSSTRMPRASHVAQSNPRSNASSSGRNRGGRRQLRWRDQRWSTYHNQP